MKDILRKLGDWALHTPAGIAITYFILCVPGFWLVRFLFTTESFLDGYCQEMTWTAIAGLCLAAVIYVLVKRKQGQAEKPQRGE